MLFMDKSVVKLKYALHAEDPLGPPEGPLRVLGPRFENRSPILAFGFLNTLVKAGNME